MDGISSEKLKNAKDAGPDRREAQLIAYDPMSGIVVVQLTTSFAPPRVEGNMKVPFPFARWSWCCARSLRL